MKLVALAFGLATVASIAPAIATPHHRRAAVDRVHHHYSSSHQAVPGYGYAARPYDGYGYPGSIIAEATARAQREPGVTLELAPDAKETATGGPAGGVPGFSGF